MKKIALISAIALSGLFYNTASAQISFGIHINTPAVRVVAETPVYAGYTAADDYYYLPEVDAYYSVAERCYYYNNGASWISAAYLPGEYRNYNWRNARYYEVRARRPYLNADVYRARYRGNVNNWGRTERFDDRSYANRDDRRNNDLRFERRNDYRGAEHADNRGWDNRGRGNDRFDGRGQNNYSQPQQQPQQQDRGRGNYNQPSQQGRNDNNGQQNQPSRQNNDGQQQRERGNNSNDHFADNRDQSGHGRFRS